MVTIQQAAEMLNTSIVTARKWLGSPDQIEPNKFNRPRFLYARKRVQAEAQKQNKVSSCTQQGEMCRICRERHCPAEMVGGRCHQCRANLCLLNFCCHNCLNCDKFDRELLRCMKNAVEALEHDE